MATMLDVELTIRQAKRDSGPYAIGDNLGFHHFVAIDLVRPQPLPLYPSSRDWYMFGLIADIRRVELGRHHHIIVPICCYPTYIVANTCT